MQKIWFVSLCRFSGRTVDAEYVFTGPGELWAVLQHDGDHSRRGPARDVGELVKQVDGELLNILELWAITSNNEERLKNYGAKITTGSENSR